MIVRPILDLRNDRSIHYGADFDDHVVPLQTEPLLKIMMQFAEAQNFDISDVQFYFDGEKIAHAHTPQELDMVDQDCIDAVLIE